MFSQSYPVQQFSTNYHQPDLYFSEPTMSTSTNFFLGQESNMYEEEDFCASTFQWDVSTEEEPTSEQENFAPPPAPTSTRCMHSMVPAKKVTTPMPDSLMSLMSSAVKPNTSKPKRKRKPVPPKVLTPLPVDFQPTDFTVLCGKGNDNYNAPGNRRFRVTISMFTEEYINATDRQEKSDLVLRVMDLVRQASPVGAFVKCVKGRWYEVDERTAREKVGAYFRDTLSGHYRSSAKSKVARRKQQKRRSSDSSVSTDSTDSCSDYSSSQEFRL
ncbi:Nitrilase family, member 2 [Seminavis robusta]|uniref:Nitrilase family, member 2 n=1 Tax=Seminavis robusta TaxID=568900 RepID=A0A9N8EQF3_9STRA|nr:Nitrilase family, member 2 [Seminavis robusta]|eukprot:Sro1549_g281630.1 Nitrilase family, member 2 (271) ;mRNA; r:8646-9458